MSARITVSEYFTSVSAYQRINASVLTLFDSYNELLSNSLYASHYINFITNENFSTYHESGLSITHENIESIEFRNVCFCYSNSTKNSLQNINLKILECRVT